MTAPSRTIHQPVSLLGLVYRLVDLASIVGGWLLVENLSGTAPQDQALGPAVAIVMHTLVAELTGLYRSWRGVSTLREVWCTFLTWTLALTLAQTFDRLTSLTIGSSLEHVCLWGVATLVLMVAVHAVLRRIRHALWHRGVNTRSVAIVGVTELGIQLARNIDAIAASASASSSLVFTPASNVTANIGASPVARA